MRDVIIIGCGVTGAAIAYALSKFKISVTILERENDVACGTTKANSAILHAGYDAEPGSLMARLNVAGSRLAQELCAKLDVPYRRCGSLVLGFDDGDRDTLRTLLRRGEENGVEGLELLTGDQAHALEPMLSSEVTAALYAPSAAIVSPWEFALAMAETAVKNGVRLCRDTEVTGLETTAQGWSVSTNAGSFETRFVVNAAGVDAETVHKMAAPGTFSIGCKRGQYDLLDKSDCVSHVIFQCPNEHGKGVLVAPTVHGNLLTGPTAEDVDGNDTATTGEGIARMRATACRSVPGVDFRQTIRSFAGVRAIADTGDFVIGEAAPGFFDAAGICSPGLTAAPAIGEYMTELLEKAGLSLVPKPSYDDTRKRIRFHDLTTSEREALVRENSAYARVVCRCETVTEGEILDALRTPIPPVSVDGVKRRCNPGMGRCQGGFCAPRVLELLARGRDAVEIPQDVSGSWLLSGRTKEERRDV